MEDDGEELRDLVVQIASVVGRTSVPPRKVAVVHYPVSPQLTLADASICRPREISSILTCHLHRLGELEFLVNAPYIRL